MGRRFKRLRHLSQQVVKITRRVFTMCRCGQVTEGIKEEIVPVASVLNGRVTSPNHGAPCRKTSACLEDRHTPSRCQRKSCSHKQRSGGTGGEVVPEDKVEVPAHKIIHVAPYRRKLPIPPGQGDVVHEEEEEPPPRTETRLYFQATDAWANLLPMDVHVRQEIQCSNFGEIEIVSREHRSKELFIMKSIRGGTGLREANLLIKCQSQFVVKLLACYTTSSITYLYMPFYRLRDVQYWIFLDKNRRLFTEQMAGWIMIHLLLSIQYIHDRNILHLDIKPSNIFIDDNGYPILGDFGGAITAGPDAHGYCFTTNYASPEVLRFRPVDKMADLWSAAATYFSLISRQLPIIAGEFEEGWPVKIIFDTSSLSPVAANFVKAQVKVEKTKRLGFHNGINDLLRHPVFAGTNWGLINRRFYGRKSWLFYRLVELRLIQHSAF
ncbi:cAMP-dependent protein kinase catalytic subunit-like [Liolophura sinensis]|uniref:cAMP-dependent protein kinase catalytic subunit-like n=1 Tax=Liolophura sinensis TaxID=3198878 RepID=UPI003157F4F0